MKMTVASEGVENPSNDRFPSISKLTTAALTSSISEALVFGLPMSSSILVRSF